MFSYAQYLKAEIALKLLEYTRRLRTHLCLTCSRLVLTRQLYSDKVRVVACEDKVTPCDMNMQYVGIGLRRCTRELKMWAVVWAGKMDSGTCKATKASRISRPSWPSTTAERTRLANTYT